MLALKNSASSLFMQKYASLPPFIFRKPELKQVSALLEKDGDFAVVGVPGIGRRTLIHQAASQANVRYMAIDCLRCRSASQFVQLFFDSIMTAFKEPGEKAVIDQWSHLQSVPLVLSRDRTRFLLSVASGKEWALFEQLLALPQHLAEALACRVAIAFHNFSHLRAWDRQQKWEVRLLQEIQQQDRVSYAIVAIVSEPWMAQMGLPVIFLGPLSDRDIQRWIVHKMDKANLSFDADSQSLELFLSYIQGHIKDAIALAQRIQLVCHASSLPSPVKVIHADCVRSSMLALVKDIEVTFEALLLLLPPTQAKLLESLSLDPTDRPQSLTYIKKHHLSRGGGLQGALSSLEQKGLIYGPHLEYRVALPLFDFWLKQRL